MTRAHVHGLAVAGASTVRALRRRDVDVTVSDDVVTPERQALADELGVELIDAAETTPEALLAGCDLFCPAPGVPETHPVVVAALAAGIDVVSEIELAYRWEQQRPGGPRPMLAVTGTDGKTTTTKLTVHLLAAGGLCSVDAGNTDTPLVDAIDDDRYDAFVVECSSFRLAWASTFRAEAAAWLNLQPDHLNWHRSMASYTAAKARIFTNQRPEDTAVAFALDPVVVEQANAAPSRVRTFGAPDADYRVEDDRLVGPGGPIAPVAAMSRRLPHDLTNALAASALVIESGLVASESIADALGTFQGPPHRLERLGAVDGVDWFNDSKATTPHAAAAAIRSFERIVLIAGGADKGVDLSPMAAEAHRVVGLVAIGTTAPAMLEVFGDVERRRDVGTLDAAVELAASWARPGDTVLLSPGCASLDQFRNFEVRGDTFRALFTSHQGVSR